MSKILDKIDEWMAREPEHISCVVVGKKELQDFKNYILKSGGRRT